MADELNRRLKIHEDLSKKSKLDFDSMTTEEKIDLLMKYTFPWMYK